MHAARYRAGLAAALAGAAVLAGCSSGGSETSATPPPPTVAAAPPPPAPAAAQGVGAKAGFAGRAARVYDAYYSHCREFTPAALVWPDEVDGAPAAAKLYAGPPREFQQPAYRGCLAGLRVTSGRFTVARVKALAEEEAKEHGLTTSEGG
jgi:hypothetical protein